MFRMGCLVDRHIPSLHSLIMTPILHRRSAIKPFRGNGGLLFPELVTAGTHDGPGGVYYKY